MNIVSILYRYLLVTKYHNAIDISFLARIKTHFMRLRKKTNVLLTFECHNGWTNNNSSSLIPQNVNNLSKKVFHFDLFFCSSNGIYIHIQQRHLSMIKKKKTIHQYYLSETRSCNFCNIPRAWNDLNDKLSFFISTLLDPCACECLFFKCLNVKQSCKA